MLYIGLSWLLYWILIEAFNVDSLKSALITGIVFVILGVLMQERPWVRA